MNEILGNMKNGDTNEIEIKDNLNEVEENNIQARKRMLDAYEKRIEESKKIAKKFLKTEGFDCDDVLLKIERDFKLMDGLILYFNAECEDYEASKIRDQLRNSYICEFVKKYK